MAEHVLSMAIFRAEPGCEVECRTLTLELAALLARKGLAHDQLWRQPGGDFVLLRRWTSAQARQQAHEDPDAHRCWARMGLVMKTLQVFEELDEIPIPSSLEEL